MREHRERDRGDCRSAYPEATSTDSARTSEALGLFVNALGDDAAVAVHLSRP
jgi:hypothetical protein